MVRNRSETRAAQVTGTVKTLARVLPRSVLRMVTGGEEANVLQPTGTPPPDVIRG